MYRARRAEARIKQMLWKVNYSDIVFINTVRVILLLASKAVTDAVSVQLRGYTKRLCCRGNTVIPSYRDIARSASHHIS